jgi:hypothetical protein
VKTFTVGTPSAGDGKPCEAKDLESAPCNPGEGACPTKNTKAVSEPTIEKCELVTVTVEKEVEVVNWKVMIEYVYSNLGCDGVSGSAAVNDGCGICGGDNSTCLDCIGTPLGHAIVDKCDVCREDPMDACMNDCFGVWGGPAAEDVCGICDGTAECADCAGVPMGPAVEDRCLK